MLTKDDKPAIWLNEEHHVQDAPRKMEPFYYDSSKYSSYLEQLGIKYPNGSVK
ncbi:hypothetical protein ACRAWD_00870 [Caulobacter segnis]